MWEALWARKRSPLDRWLSTGDLSNFKMKVMGVERKTLYYLLLLLHLDSFFSYNSISSCCRADEAKQPAAEAGNNSQDVRAW